MMKLKEIIVPKLMNSETAFKTAVKSNSKTSLQFYKFI